MFTVPSRARMLSICSRPTGATNQRKMERHYLIQRNFPAVSLKNSIQVSNKVLVTFSCVCVCVTENRNLCKGTAVRFSQTGSTGQRKRILERPFLRKNFHSDRVSRWKFPDNSSQWKALLVCLCHLFKIRTIWGQIREPAGPICSFAEISAPWVNTTKFNF